MATVLPPGVQAPRKGHLTLTLTWDPSQWSASLWSQRVRVKWWGERGDGQLLRPSLSASAALPGDDEVDASTLRYDIACGPQQLAKYLGDMRMLVLDLEEVDGEDASGTVHTLGYAYL